VSLQGLAGASAKELGPRFNLVSMLPNGALVLFVGVLLAAGAPQHPPELQRLLQNLQSLNGSNIALLAVAVLVFSLILHPFQLSLVRLLEGYWGGSRLSQALGALGVEVNRRRKEDLQLTARGIRDAVLGEAQQPTADMHAAAGPEGGPHVTEAQGAGSGAPHPASWTVQSERQTQADEELRRYPDEGPLLPTRLGNVLRAAESKAGQRYGLETIVVWPRLYPHVSKSRASLEDARNQLDTIARLCAVLMLATVISIALLAPYRWWLAVPLVTGMLAWLAYRATIHAAAAFADELYVAFDLHRFDMLEGLRLPLPPDATSEVELNQQLSVFFQMDQHVDLLPLPRGYAHATARPEAAAATDESQTPPSPGADEGRPDATPQEAGDEGDSSRG
jgi:hypothetical protein